MAIKNFNRLLLNYSQVPDDDQRTSIENQIWDSFGTEKTVLILDMSGFSLLSERYGIVHYLSMVRRMQMTSRPIVENFGGTVIKFEADNCFAAFDKPLAAVRTAIALNLAFDAANILTPDELDIRISCGIDHGRILIIENRDFFGNAVNRASKLGEDIARPGDILVSQDAMDMIPSEAGIAHTPVTFEISGIEIPCCSITYRQSREQA